MLSFTRIGCNFYYPHKTKGEPFSKGLMLLDIFCVFHAKSLLKTKAVRRMGGAMVGQTRKKKTVTD